jgi:hypothetical protein
VYLSADFRTQRAIASTKKRDKNYIHDERNGAIHVLNNNNNNNNNNLFSRCQTSSVGISMGYMLTGRRIGVRFPAGVTDRKCRISEQ